MSVAKYYSRVVVLHCCAILLLLGSVLSGLRLALSAGRGDFFSVFNAYLPQGGMHGLHLSLGFAWCVLALIFVWHHWHAPARVASSTLAETWNRYLIHFARYLFLSLLILGGALYFGGSAALDGWVLLLHRYLAYSAFVYLIVHAFSQMIYSPWLQVRAILLPKLKVVRQVGWKFWLPVSLAAVLWLGSAWIMPYLTPQLRIANLALDQEIVIDGLANESAWQSAPLHTVKTLNIGANAAETPVTVQGLRQGEVVYFRFSWPDTTPSLQHLPLVKTAQGWRIEQTGLLRNDETQFYEDKFAVMLARAPDAAGAGSMLLGSQPLAGYAANRTGRGYHAAQGALLDVWHWKSVRNHGTKQLDDSHFAAAYPEVPGEIRYTAGYKSDPLQSGGYSENWAWPSNGIVTPKRLPRDPAQLARFQAAKPNDPQLVWGMSWYETLPYSSAADQYPVGTRMPSVLWTTMFEGDRGDVRAMASWHKGVWTLEAVRGIKTESPFDLALNEGLFMWVAVFDHQQTQHSYHLRPLQLHFEGQS
ncbi:ethylbenzene dehydrogenase-related protein [uncultured Deefgea sp.]|uniref:ethylbenzene dehydrogenase-related protein n=1 Tax=uncultured Deefgea sp. TaxID=1304914 RepID=UPI002639C52D|nr:ethylbenzene dehydrogenase-related protein [uncultured Deefgea sp.]